eukprot:3754833-Pleurochrysis_carterae.AAC.1
MGRGNFGVGATAHGGDIVNAARKKGAVQRRACACWCGGVCAVRSANRTCNATPANKVRAICMIN